MLNFRIIFKEFLDGSEIEDDIGFGEQLVDDDFDEDDGGDGDEEDSIEREIEENDLVDEVGSGSSRFTMFCA